MTICVHCIHTCYPLRRNCVFSNDFLSFDVENEKVVSNLKRSNTHIPKQIECIIEKKTNNKESTSKSNNEDV